MKDYYNILGVSKDASEADIKKAYKKLALKYHPDRQQGKSDEEKKEAEDKFKEINEAFSVIGDEKKRKEYDNPGFGSDFFSNFGNFGNDFNSSTRDPFEEFFGRRTEENPYTNAHNYTDFHGDNCEAKLDLNISDFYTKGVKKVTFIKKCRCKTCDGQGGTGIKMCPHCNGTGMVTESRRQGNMFFQSSHPCPYCNGTGKIVEKKCPDCSGTGFIGKLTEEKIDLKKIPTEYLLKDGLKINVGPLGSESKMDGGTNGALYVTIHHNYDKKKYKITGRGDVTEKVDVAFKDILLGSKIEVDLPNNKKMKVKIPECCEAEAILKMVGKGIDGNDYYIKVNPTFPKKLTTEQKNIIEKF